MKHNTIENNYTTIKALTTNKTIMEAREASYRRKYSVTQNYEDHFRYVLKRNSIRKLTRQLRIDYEAGIAKSIRNNPKRF